jgi:hypothetical protein
MRSCILIGLIFYLELEGIFMAAIVFEQDFYIGRLRETQEDGEKLDMEFV